VSRNLQRALAAQDHLPHDELILRWAEIAQRLAAGVSDLNMPKEPNADWALA
jgi:hypothetical protein